MDTDRDSPYVVSNHIFCLCPSITLTPRVYVKGQEVMHKYLSPSNVTEAGTRERQSSPVKCVPFVLFKSGCVVCIEL